MFSVQNVNARANWNVNGNPSPWFCVQLTFQRRWCRWVDRSAWTAPVVWSCSLHSRSPAFVNKLGWQLDTSSDVIGRDTSPLTAHSPLPVSCSWEGFHVIKSKVSFWFLSQRTSVQHFFTAHRICNTHHLIEVVSPDLEALRVRLNGVSAHQVGHEVLGLVVAFAVSFALVQSVGQRLQLSER